MYLLSNRSKVIKKKIIRAAKREGIQNFIFTFQTLSRYTELCERLHCLRRTTRLFPSPSFKFILRAAKDLLIIFTAVFLLPLFSKTSIFLAPGKKLIFFIFVADCHPSNTAAFQKPALVHNFYHCNWVIFDSICSLSSSMFWLQS